MSAPFKYANGLLGKAQEGSRRQRGRQANKSTSTASNNPQPVSVPSTNYNWAPLTTVDETGFQRGKVGYLIYTAEDNNISRKKRTITASLPRRGSKTALVSMPVDAPLQSSIDSQGWGNVGQIKVEYAESDSQKIVIGYLNKT